jgi:hypothetical protein
MSTISIFMFLPPFLVVRIPIEFADTRDQNRSSGDEQLDDSIVDTLVSALPLAVPCHISSDLQTELLGALWIVPIKPLVCATSG